MPVKGSRRDPSRPDSEDGCTCMDPDRCDSIGHRIEMARGEVPLPAGRLTDERERRLRPARCDLYGEFDPGSGRTLAVRLTHASRTVNRASARGSVANGCVTRGQPAPDPGITPGNRS